MGKGKFLSLPLVMVLAVLVTAALGMNTAVRYYKYTLRKLPIYPQDGRLLNSIPFETTSWLCTTGDHRESPEVEETLGTKNYITRNYKQRGDKGKTLQLHAAYYTGMIDTVPHVADRCFVAGGMQLGTLTRDLPLPLDKDRFLPDHDVPDALKGRIFRTRTEDGVHRPRLPRDPQDIKIHSMTFRDDRGRDLYAGYFFLANGACVPRAEDVRLLAFDLRATYAYYLKIQVTTLEASSQEELASLSASLLDELFGDIMRCTPDWVEVEAGRYPPADQKNTDTNGKTERESPAQGG